MKVSLLHPELGFGGAERFMLDAALELQARGHAVRLYTARYDPELSFPEARHIDVRVHAGAVPENLGGRFRAPCSIARMLALARRASRESPDVLVCDLVAQVVPALKRMSRAPVMFYCHFPDRFLANPGDGAFYRAYRMLIDHLELKSLQAADRVLVNSRFTADVVERLGCPADVLYPGIDASRFRSLEPPGGDAVRLLVVSRFDPRKNLLLAVQALDTVRSRAPDVAERVTLRIVGGLDPRRPDALSAQRSLESEIRRLGLAGTVSTHTNPSDAELLAHFAWSTCILHTALGEHFGLVPLEAMAAGRPVLAIADGGPRETVVDGQTGWLRPADPGALAAVIETLARDPLVGPRVGAAGRVRLEEEFTRERFGERLESALFGLL